MKQLWCHTLLTLASPAKCVCCCSDITVFAETHWLDEGGFHFLLRLFLYVVSLAEPDTVIFRIAGLETSSWSQHSTASSPSGLFPSLSLGSKERGGLLLCSPLGENVFQRERKLENSGVRCYPQGRMWCQNWERAGCGKLDHPSFIPSCSYQSSFWKFRGVSYPVPAAVALAELSGWLCLCYAQWFEQNAIILWGMQMRGEGKKWKKGMYQSLSNWTGIFGAEESRCSPSQLPSCQMLAVNSAERGTRADITIILFQYSIVCEIIDHSWIS